MSRARAHRAGQQRKALLVPEQAIVPMGEQKNVYTVVQGKAKLVPVDDRHAPAGLVESPAA
jgi:hypothetical protein